MNKSFFFDRDGILVETVYRVEQGYEGMRDCAPFRLADLRIIKHAREAVSYVSSRGFKPIVVTNQSDFVKKGIPLGEYEAITREVCSQLGFERGQIFECLHRKEAGCLCKKPKPGLLLMAKGLYDLSMPDSWLVGDSWSDIVAAKNAGVANTIFLMRDAIPNKQKGNKADLLHLENNEMMPRYLISDLDQIAEIL